MMSASKQPSDFEPAAYIKKSLNTMKLEGQHRRSSVVMEATIKDAPSVKGAPLNDHIKEGF